jgi:GntR family transcriptional regulator
MDRSSPIPLYQQIRQILGKKIKAGELSTGEMLPSEAEFEEIFGVSRVTVRQALNTLARAGYITRERGRGSFVTFKVQDDREARSERLRGFMEEQAEQGHSVGCRVIFNGTVPAPPQIAEKLDLHPGTPCYYIRRIGLVEEIPIVCSEVWLAIEDDLGISREAMEKEVAIYTWLKEILNDRFGKTLGEGDKTLEATLATPEEADLLETVPGAPLMMAKVIFRSTTEEPLIHIKACYRGDRYAYSIKLHP